MWIQGGIVLQCERYRKISQMEYMAGLARLIVSLVACREQVKYWFCSLDGLDIHAFPGININSTG